MPQTLSEIKAALASRGLRPKHALGQNFLHDGNHLRAIVEAAEVGPGDRVLEVGPGTGTLTGALLDAGAEVVAVELDAGLAGLVRERFGGSPGFTLVEGDCLDGKHGLNAEMLDRLDSGDDTAAPPTFKLVANLPYQAASPLLANLAGLPGRPVTTAVVMLQKEVADRLAAEPGGRAYGALGVLLQAGHAIERLAVLPASCFWPQPKVASAVVRLIRRDEPLVTDPAAFGRFPPPAVREAAQAAGRGARPRVRLPRRRGSRRAGGEPAAGGAGRAVPAQPRGRPRSRMSGSCQRASALRARARHAWGNKELKLLGTGLGPPTVRTPRDRRGFSAFPPAVRGFPLRRAEPCER